MSYIQQVQRLAGRRLSTSTVRSRSTGGTNNNNNALIPSLTSVTIPSSTNNNNDNDQNNNQRMNRNYYSTLIVPSHKLSTQQQDNNDPSLRRLCATYNNDLSQTQLKPQNYYQSMMMTIHHRRDYSSSTKLKRSGPTLVLTFTAIAATAKAGQYAVQAYQEYKVNQPPPEEEEGEIKEEEQEGGGDAENNTSKAEGTKDENTQKTSSSTTSGEKRENIFAKYFDMGVGSKYYEGGFEDKMTKREAALILGVRVSSTAKRIKEAHRKLLILNHPDTGGSTYLSGKLNEAKDLLLKGKQKS
jgi:DnaJ family protein C protein 19